MSLTSSKASRYYRTRKPEHAQPVSWHPFVVHGPLQASAGAGSGALNKAELTQRIMLAQLQSAVYEDIAAAARSDGFSVLGLRLPELTHSAMLELSPGQCFLYEDSLGSGLPSAQERRCAPTARSIVFSNAYKQPTAVATQTKDRVVCMCRLTVALQLLPWRFDLGFRALHAFCPEHTARIFTAVAGTLAGRGRTAELRGVLQNIQGTVTPDEWDQVLK